MTRHYLVRYDQTGDAALREARRGDHIAYRKGLGDALCLAGPILNDADVPVGSVVIIAATDSAAARALACADPFVREGLLSIASIEPIRIAAMRPPAPTA
jgi:uncharacterized protein YciI